MALPATTTAAPLVTIAGTQQCFGGISRSAVYELIAQGEIEAVKIGRRRLIVADSIDAYIDRLRAEAGR